LLRDGDTLRRSGLIDFIATAAATADPWSRTESLVRVLTHAAHILLRASRTYIHQYDLTTAVVVAEEPTRPLLKIPELELHRGPNGGPNALVQLKSNVQFLRDYSKGTYARG
jgi:hypothetical protein